MRLSNREPLAPRDRELLQLLWENARKIPIDKVPHHLQVSLTSCKDQRPPLARIMGIGGEPYVVLTGDGQHRLFDEQRWDESPKADATGNKPHREIVAYVAELICRLVAQKIGCLDWLKEIDRDSTLEKVAYYLLRQRLLENAEQFSILGHSDVARRLIERRDGINVAEMLEILDSSLAFLGKEYPAATPNPEEVQRLSVASLAEMRARFVQKSLVDEQGNLLGTEADVPRIMDMAPEDLDRIYVAAAEVNRLPTPSQDKSLVAPIPAADAGRREPDWGIAEVGHLQSDAEEPRKTPTYVEGRFVAAIRALVSFAEEIEPHRIPCDSIEYSRLQELSARGFDALKEANVDVPQIQIPTGHKPFGLMRIPYREPFGNFIRVMVTREWKESLLGLIPTLERRERATNRPRVRESETTLCGATDKVVQDAEPEATRKTDPGTDERSYLGPKTLAEKYDVPLGPLRERLKRWREKNAAQGGSLWIENRERKPREPQYIYQVAAVRHIIEDLRATSQTTTERPSKKI
jgi:hypothetical protein